MGVRIHVGAGGRVVVVRDVGLRFGVVARTDWWVRVVGGHGGDFGGPSHISDWREGGHNVAV